MGAAYTLPPLPVAIARPDPAKCFLSRQVHPRGKGSVMGQPQVFTDPGASKFSKPCPKDLEHSVYIWWKREQSMDFKVYSVIRQLEVQYLQGPSHVCVLMLQVALHALNENDPRCRREANK